MYTNSLFIKIVILFLSTFYSVSVLPSEIEQQNVNKYGVFLGINGDEMEKLNDYQIVVIEPEEFTSEEIAKLHEKNKTVYAYLNIGAIENYRSYYPEFKNNTLGEYENWQDEFWIDVSAENWQNYIKEKLAPKYINMGFDGFFLDNTDVYYHYQTDDIFYGLCDILRTLKKYNTTLLINGGDVFVERCITENLSKLFDGINQETVFTSIDFDNATYSAQVETETAYFKDYLNRVKALKLKVYLLEYGADKELEQKIARYCKQNDFLYYNAESIELK